MEASTRARRSSAALLASSSFRAMRVLLPVIGLIVACKEVGIESGRHSLEACGWDGTSALYFRKHLRSMGSNSKLTRHTGTHHHAPHIGHTSHRHAPAHRHTSHHGVHAAASAASHSAATHAAAHHAATRIEATAETSAGHRVIESHCVIIERIHISTGEVAIEASSLVHSTATRSIVAAPATAETTAVVAVIVAVPGEVGGAVITVAWTRWWPVLCILDTAVRRILWQRAEGVVGRARVDDGVLLLDLARLPALPSDIVNEVLGSCRGLLRCELDICLSDVEVSNHTVGDS